MLAFFALASRDETSVMAQSSAVASVPGILVAANSGVIRGMLRFVVKVYRFATTRSVRLSLPSSWSCFQT